MTASLPTFTVCFLLLPYELTKTSVINVWLKWKSLFVLFSSNLLRAIQIVDSHKTSVVVPWTDTTVSFCLFQTLAHGARCKNVMPNWITGHIHRLCAVLLSLSLPQIKLHSSIAVVLVFSHVQVAQSYTVIGGICCLIFVLNVDRFHSWGVTTVIMLAKGNMI